LALLELLVSLIEGIFVGLTDDDDAVVAVVVVEICEEVDVVEGALLEIEELSVRVGPKYLVLVILSVTGRPV
jgi:hypothetical protein